MYKVCECGKVCETKQSYCGHHEMCKVAHPELVNRDYSYLKGRHWTQKSWIKGLTKETDPRVKKISETLSRDGRDTTKVKEAAKNRDRSCYKKQSETRKRKFMSGELTPPIGAGRGKYSYITIGDRSILLRSTYEFIFALYLLYSGIEFEYETVRVPCVTDYKCQKTFLSDFKIGNKVVEIKGFYSSKIAHAKAAFEAAGYEYEIKYWKDIVPCYEYLKSKIDIDNIIESIRIGHDSKMYYEYKFGE